MAKGEGNRGRLPTRQVAGELLAARFHELLAYRDKVLADGKKKDIHDLRVSGRKLLVALEDLAFCFPDEEAHFFARAVKKTLRPLGRLRDNQLLADQLKKWVKEAEDPESAKALEDFYLHKKLACKLLQKEAAQKLDKSLSKKFSRAFLEFLEENPAAAADGDSPRSLPLARTSGQIVASRASEFLALTLSLLERPLRLDHPFDLEQLHKLRLCVKGFRYSLDLFRPWLPPFAEERAFLAEFQTLLGAIHDLYVQEQELQNHFAAARDDNLPAKVRQRMEEARAARKSHLDRFREVWAESGGEARWTRMILQLTGVENPIAN